MLTPARATKQKWPERHPRLRCPLSLRCWIDPALARLFPSLYEKYYGSAVAVPQPLAANPGSYCNGVRSRLRYLDLLVYQHD